MQEAERKADFPTTDEEVKDFLNNTPKVDVPEKYKTPEWLFNKLEMTCASETCAYRGKGICQFVEGEFCPMYIRKK